RQPSRGPARQTAGRGRLLLHANTAQPPGSPEAAARAARDIPRCLPCPQLQRSALTEPPEESLAALRSRDSQRRWGKLEKVSRRSAGWPIPIRKFGLAASWLRACFPAGKAPRPRSARRG